MGKLLCNREDQKNPPLLVVCDLDRGLKLSLARPKAEEGQPAEP